MNKQTQFLEKFVKSSDEFDKEEEIIATNGETFPWDDLRLPKFIHPVRYDIELTPNLTSLWVKGNFFCLIKWKQYSKIKSHFHELNVRKVSVFLVQDKHCWTYFIKICCHIAEKFGIFFSHEKVKVTFMRPYAELTRVYNSRMILDFFLFWNWIEIEKNL